MENEFNKVTEILNRLNILQAHHIQLFGQNSMPDIEIQNHEREREFTDLKIAVNLLLKKAEEVKDKTKIKQRLQFCNRIIAGLIKQNNVIEEKIKAHRERIGREMKKLAFGKKVLGSYGTTHGLSKVMSITR